MNKIIAEDFKLKEEDKKNFKNSIIERGNLTNEFTLTDIETHMTELDRLQRENEGQVRVSKAAVGNIERQHPFVSKLSDEQLAAAEYLFNVKTTLAKAEQTLKEVKATKKKYKEIVDTIYKKFGFVESEVIKNKDE